MIDGLTCNKCGKQFTAANPRKLDRKICMECYRAAAREAYRRANLHRYRKKPGPKPGTTRKVFDTEKMKADLAAFRAEQEAERAAGPRDYPHTCEYCSHYQYNAGLITSRFCDIDLPIIDNGCPGFVAAYTAGGEDE